MIYSVGQYILSKKYTLVHNSVIQTIQTHVSVSILQFYIGVYWEHTQVHSACCILNCFTLPSLHVSCFPTFCSSAIPIARYIFDVFKSCSGLTLVSEGFGSLAELQRVHRLLHWRCH